MVGSMCAGVLISTRARTTVGRKIPSRSLSPTEVPSELGTSIMDYVSIILCHDHKKNRYIRITDYRLGLQMNGLEINLMLRSL